MADLLIADTRQSRIVTLSGDQVVATFGGPGSGVGEFTLPSGLARFGATGILIADRGNGRIVSMDDLSGANWQTLGSPGTGNLEFRDPSGVAVDDNGLIWIADSGNRRIVRVDDMSGSGWTAFGMPGRPTPTDPAIGKFWDPIAISSTPAGQVLIADPGAGRIVRISDIAGVGWASSAFGALIAPTSVVPYSSGFLVADFGAARVVVLNAGLSVERAATDARLTGVGTVRQSGLTILALVPPLRTIASMEDDGTTVTVREEVRLAPLGLDRPLTMEVAP